MDDREKLCILMAEQDKLGDDAAAMGGSIGVSAYDAFNVLVRQMEINKAVQEIIRRILEATP